MIYLYQAAKAWLADWSRHRWLDLRAWAVLQWSKLRNRNTGDE